MKFTLINNRLIPKSPHARENVAPGGQGTAFLELGSIFACMITVSEEV